MAYLGVSPSNGVRQKHTYTVTGTSTDTFSGVGSENITLSYKDTNYVDVYQNGVKLGDADYTANTGTSIVLGTNASDGDIVEIVVYDVFSVADTVSKADGGQFDNAVTITTADNNAQLTLKSTDADSSTGPVLDLTRDSASPADGDSIGEIIFKADDDGGNSTEFASIQTKISDASNGSESGKIEISNIVAGTSRKMINVKSSEVSINDDQVDVDFRVESATNSHGIFLDAGNEKTGIFTSNPNDYYADSLVLTAPDEGGMSIVQGTGHRGYLAFADGTSGSQAYRGFISYDHNNDELSLGHAGATKVTMTSGNVKIEDGDLIIGTSGHGIDFSATSDATGMTGEILDDYEEGTYTPTVGGSSSGSYTLGDSATKLTYVKIGKMVHLQGQIHITGESSPSGTVTVSLPFSSGDTTDLAERTCGTVAFDGSGSNGPDHNSSNYVTFFVSTGGTFGTFRTVFDNAAAGSLTNSHITTNDRFTIGITYKAN